MEGGADLCHFVENFCSYCTEARPVSRREELTCSTIPSLLAVEVLEPLAQPDLVFAGAAEWQNQARVKLWYLQLSTPQMFFQMLRKVQISSRCVWAHPRTCVKAQSGIVEVGKEP